MPRGGARPGAGRKPGAALKKARDSANRLAADGLLPLDYLVGVMRGTVEFEEPKFEAAKAAAPYMHPRLAAVEFNGTIKRSAADFSDAELAAIAAGGGAGTAEPADGPRVVPGLH